MQKPGPIARRHLILGAATILATLKSPPKARAQQKWNKKDAAYQATPKGDQLCSGCTLFQPPRGCSVVEGDIDPRGWCKLFEEPPE